MRQHAQTNPLMAFRPAVLALSRALFTAIGASAAPIHILDDLRAADHEEPNSSWVLYVASICLVLLGGAFAGLTIALMGQDSVYLQVISQDPTEPQQKNANRVLQLLDKGKHWVLVTLLLSNVIVNETLPVVLDRCLGGGVAAVVGSTVLIVIFGEVVPQSICVRYGLAIGGYMSTPVLLMMYLMAPVAWPTAKLLDWVLGEDHGTVYKKSGLKTLVTLHHNMGPQAQRLNEDEVTIIGAVLELKEKPVHDVMTPMDDVFVLSEEAVLNEEMIDMLLSAGYSRIPIHEAGNPTNFIGMLLVKILITYDPEDCKKVRDFPLATLPETRPETSCLDIINFFQEGKSHMVLVSESPGDDHGALGVVTLEDVIEELIGEEIIDESDVYIDVHKAIRRMAPAPKARHQRRPSHGGQPIPDANDGKSSEDTKVGEEDASDENRKRSYNSVPDQNEPRDRSGSPMTGTFLLRRTSAGIDGRMENVPVRASLNDIRQHLKHLGPSNPASNPKATRSTTVKIKPGTVVLDQPRSHTVADEAIQEEPRDEEAEDDNGDETTSLLPPRGKVAPKDGVQALAQSYGAVGASTLSRGFENVPPIKVDVPKEDRPIQASPHPLTPDVAAATSSSAKPEQRSSSGSETSPSGSNSPYGPKKGLFARSGSITENVVESRGIRKVVLETTSSNSDDDDEHLSGGGRSGKAASRSNLSLSKPSQSHPSPTPEGNEDEEGSGGASTTAGAPAEGSSGGAGTSADHQNGGSNGGGGASGGGGKKKNRRKKRKGGKF
ncbi:hypothetical protein VPNG_09742 [Cytospora leucostoma]|uniref:CNNM transmembrane domain-containing protein n=1 Tax=Cytospora leucostoma TaxID=1230097 RepID=A0A423VKU0_9PEZI|nr:hypothetical protein VPNG_09742 [Cytospora leucostoma]